MWWKKNMEPLDWSRFSDILIEDEEGQIQPMSEPYFKERKIADGVWQVLSDVDYSYVIEGEEEADVIDVGMGAGNIRAFCQTLTEKPIYRMSFPSRRTFSKPVLNAETLTAEVFAGHLVRSLA